MTIILEEGYYASLLELLEKKKVPRKGYIPCQSELSHAVLNIQREKIVLLFSIQKIIL